MAQWKKGDKLQVKEGIEDSRMGGFPVSVFEVDETTISPKLMYMVEFRDPAMLDGEHTGAFFWILEDNLEEVLENGSDETGM